MLGFAVGAVGVALYVLADPRRRFLRPSPRHYDAWWRQALAATLPSTVGLAVLCGIALAVSGILAAVLAGMILGLGIGGAVAAFSTG